MAKNEDGEFELILGNRQLISVFLIVVILLGVFFSMGYIVGRNSAPTVAESARDSKPAVLHWPAPADANAADSAKSPGTPTPAAEPASPAPADTGTHPARDVAPPAPAAPTPVPAAPAQKTKSSPLPPASPAASVTADLAPGEYWQVVATARPDAEIITETLRKKGFHAVMAPAPKEGVFRVLVGPLKDAATQAQTRTALEAAGFKNPIVRKY
ncbi:MAG TPA: SPOR domain-containing protein [Bryobacteraceae bacterium]|nr:SPOR domain-containing protein [Bryobacteraceae bacterium]